MRTSTIFGVKKLRFFFETYSVSARTRKGGLS